MTVSRIANESVFTNSATPVRIDLKQHFTKPADPPLEVERSSIIRLRKWARSRYMEARSIKDHQHATYEMNYFEGWIAALDEVLEMENQ